MQQFPLRAVEPNKPFIIDVASAKGCRDLGLSVFPDPLGRVQIERISSSAWRLAVPEGEYVYSVSEGPFDRGEGSIQSTSEIETRRTSQLLSLAHERWQAQLPVQDFELHRSTTVRVTHLFEKSGADEQFYSIVKATVCLHVTSPVQAQPPCSPEQSLDLLQPELTDTDFEFVPVARGDIRGTVNLRLSTSVGTHEISETGFQDVGLGNVGRPLSAYVDSIFGGLRSIFWDGMGKVFGVLVAGAALLWRRSRPKWVGRRRDLNKIRESLSA